MTLVFTADDVKFDVTLCKLDVSVKDGTAVAARIGFFKLEYNFFKRKSVTLWQVLLLNSNVLIKRYARKSIYHGCMVWTEKSVTRDHCSATLGKPRDTYQ